MDDDTSEPKDLVPEGSEPLDLAVYAHRILAVLRPLGPRECEAVLRAALELNHASLVRRQRADSADESGERDP